MDLPPPPISSHVHDPAARIISDTNVSPLVSVPDQYPLAVLAARLASFKVPLSKDLHPPLFFFFSDVHVSLARNTVGRV